MAVGRARALAAWVLIVAGSAGFGGCVGYLIHLFGRVRRLDGDAAEVGLLPFTVTECVGCHRTEVAALRVTVRPGLPWGRLSMTCAGCGERMERACEPGEAQVLAAAGAAVDGDVVVMWEPWTPSAAASNGRKEA